FAQGCGKGQPASKPPPPAGPPGPAVHVPASIPADCSRDVIGELNAFLARVPDRSTVRFPREGCYKGAGTIFVKDHTDFVVDGNGSTFTITSQGDDKKPGAPGWNKTGGNWLILRGTNVTLENLTAIGSFPLAGQTRRLAVESALPGYAEYMPNFGVYGTTGANLVNLIGRAAWGDTVTAGPDTYVDNSVKPRYASNVHVERVVAQEASRMCFGLTSGTNLWLTDSSCKGGWYGGSDEEADAANQPLNGIHILRNTWDGFGLFGIDVPVATKGAGNIEIRDNHFLTAPDNKCSPTVVVGGYPNNPATFANVVIENNDFVSFAGTVVLLDHVVGGSVRNNKVTKIGGGGCGQAPGTAVPVLKTAHSSGVGMGNNGPDAPGAAPRRP
ncbi:MAG: hypothetical protein LC749_08460, partial [Actinobacteria bacterium]|nr:hypothetical protein [Actinomycetota bacterium]